MNLIFSETRVIGLHFVADSMGLSSFKFVQWAPKDASILQQSAGQKRILLLKFCYYVIKTFNMLLNTPTFSKYPTVSDT